MNWFTQTISIGDAAIPYWMLVGLVIALLALYSMMR